MFSFIKSYTQMFMTRYLFLEISENKKTEYLILIGGFPLGEMVP